MIPSIVRLSSRRAVNDSLTGGKGAGLARVFRAGFPVPPGFVITTAAFREPIGSAQRLVPSGRPDRKSLESARRVLLDWNIPVTLSRKINRACRRLGGPVAVRSSLVGEDSEPASYAGLLDTVLDVHGDEALFDAVRRTLASAFGERLWAYMDREESRTRRPHSLAVVVQSMVRAKASGVAFSLDPVTCRPGVIIEAVPGLGEALVQGRVRPDRYRLDPRGEIDESLPVRPQSPLLNEPNVRELGALVRSIADFAGTAQDVEWSWDGRRFQILQARPISSIAGKTVYSRRIVSDMAPGLVKPLIWSTKYATIVKNVFAPLFETLSGRTGMDYTGMSARFYSRVYMNVTLIGELFARVGLPPNFFEIISRDEKAGRNWLRFRLRMLPTFFRLVRFAVRESRVERRVDSFLNTQHRKLDEFRAMDWASQSPAALLEQLGRLQALHADSQWYVVIISINMLIRSRILGRMIVRRWPGTDPGDVIKGYGRRSSLMPFEELRKMADMTGDLDSELVARIAGDSEFDLSGSLEATEPGRRLLGEFELFMKRYGFLSANGSDFSEVPWVENPRLIWRTVARLVLAQPSRTLNRAEAHREETLGLVRAGFGPVRRRAFNRLHASTVRFIAWRERTSFLMTEDSYLMRRSALALGEKLSELKVFAAPADVFYFFGDELERILRDPAEAAGANAKISARKAEMARDEALDPPDTFCGGTAVNLERPNADGLEFLSGIGASAGVREGRARIVHDPARDAVLFEPSDILVVPFTDVGWTPVLAAAGGIVAETGGQLSHTSIIAREFGIPAVVSVRNATRLVREGQVITIDGTAGRIHLHPGNPT
jgi:phosphohistidine swiveling domain-containing protein